MASVTGGGSEELKALAARLKSARQVLLGELRRELKQAADPLTGAVREAIEASPSRHDGTLRRETAKTVSSSISVTASRVTLAIVSAGDRMPEGKGNLPAYLNDDKRWKHPVYGNRRNWVKQGSRAGGWFSQTITDRAPELQAAVEAAMDETARKLEGR